MSFDLPLLELMPSTIRVSTRTSHNNYGEPSYAASTATYRCRIVQKPEFIRTAADEVIEVSHTIWARSTGATTITVDDRITLPDGTQPQIMAVWRYPDTDGIHHTKLLLGHGHGG